ncbi:DNase I-like protein, partial [Schizophyllum commune Loenen D]
MPDVLPRRHPGTARPLRQTPDTPTARAGGGERRENRETTSDDGQRDHTEGPSRAQSEQGDETIGSEREPSRSQDSSDAQTCANTPNRAQRRAAETQLRKQAKTIATLNINGFGTLTRDHPRNKWGAINRMMNSQKIAILMLQETHLTEERKARIESMFSGKLKVYHSPHPTHPKSRAGVAIVINRRLVDTEGAKMTVITPGRALHLTVKWAPNEERTFLCIYAPASGPAERTTFFEQVSEYYRSHTNLTKPHAMAGDFNVLEDNIDRLPMSETHDNSIQALDALKISLGLNMADGWRATYPDTRDFTFCRNQENGPYLARLDRIYCNAASFATARQWKISEPGIRTDHSVASVQLTCESSPEMGKGRPKLSEWIIKDKAFAKYTKERGIFAMNELAFLQETGIRTDTRNALQVLEDFTEDCFTMGRERERVLVPE